MKTVVIQPVHFVTRKHDQDIILKKELAINVLISFTCYASYCYVYTKKLTARSMKTKH